MGAKSLVVLVVLVAAFMSVKAESQNHSPVNTTPVCGTTAGGQCCIGKRRCPIGMACTGGKCIPRSTRAHEFSRHPGTSSGHPGVSIFAGVPYGLPIVQALPGVPPTVSSRRATDPSVAPTKPISVPKDDTVQFILGTQLTAPFQAVGGPGAINSGHG